MPTKEQERLMQIQAPVAMVGELGEIVSRLEDIANHLESLAKSAHKIANPLVMVVGDGRLGDN